MLLPNLFVPPFMKRLTLGVPRSLSYQDPTNVVGGSSFVRAMQIFSGSNEGFCLAWLSSHIATIRRITSGMQTAGWWVDELRMRGKSITLLQQQLSKYPKLSRESLVAVRLHVTALFQGECMAGDSKAARTHARILFKLDGQLMDEFQYVHHIMILMWNATELACKRLERTLIPFDASLERPLSKFWSMASSHLPQMSVEDQNVHPCVANRLLRTAFIRLRYCFSIGDSTIPFTNAAERLRGDMLFGWIATKTFFDMGLLITLYADLIEGMELTRSEAKRLTEACMILTFLHVLRKGMHEAPINGVDVRDASHVMMPRLARHLQEAMRILNPAERLRYSHAYLWMFYVGTVWEKRLEYEKTFEVLGNAYPQYWFSQMFAKHACELNIWAWPDAVVILKRFVYSDHLSPSGHVWFEEVICGQGTEWSL
ncbi:hypothetical protein PV08_00521 [Exophiala spinifera]|uniref:Transcription factor domain-containing protein n=1 Tax=Exophiala spinifera TaxID=91928 RepID=A0A0D1YXE9_9EURO|nr:uncharacterized protein PV08_00521 [Exophiala spinifera]KIW19946.1 hypothetical protein PV08_00521 [Exophiala spinifera]